MEIVYHYPPELFQLLVDTIPRLCRSKDDVLGFFKGAGVDFGLLDDLWAQVDRDRDKISKYEIVRTVLDRLNEKGEAALRERRVILRRVVEFEDFSTCWPSDQLKARGLVAQIRKVVNVKDSFTRMKQERDQEARKRRADYRAEVKSLAERDKALRQIKDDLFALFSVENPQKRGKLLESVLNRLFNASGILVREAFEIVGSGEEGVIVQIDGVIELDGYNSLVEMKWWKKRLGRAEVSPHLVNVFNRGHVGGILISASGYTDPAIQTCKEALSQKVILLCELEEFVTLLEAREDLTAFLKSKFNAATIDKKPLVRPLNTR